MYKNTRNNIAIKTICTFGCRNNSYQQEYFYDNIINLYIKMIYLFHVFLLRTITLSGLIDDISNFFN